MISIHSKWKFICKNLIIIRLLLFQVAQVRCRETAELLRARQQTLMKAKQQFETDSVRQRPHSTVEQVLDQVSEVMCAYSPKVYQSTSPLWTPSFSTSTPYYPYARRRSVSGMPYSLVSSPYSYFGVSVTPGHKRHNSLGANMLISEEQDENCDPMDNGGSLSPDIPITADDTPDLAQVHCKDECPGTSAESSVDGENVGISEKTENENDGMNLTISSPASLSQSQVNKLMKRSQTWQFEDDVWDVLPPRPSCGLGQLTKNPVTGGSAESIPR